MLRPMRVLNDFHCTECDIRYDDQLVDNEALTIDCLHCEGLATKVRSIPNFKLPHNDPAGFPSAHRKWTTNRDKQIAHEKRASYHED